MLDRLGAHIPRRRRVAAHLQNRISADPEPPCDLPPAHPVQEHKLSDGHVKLHPEHPRIVPSRFGKGRSSNGRLLRRPTTPKRRRSIGRLSHRPPHGRLETRNRCRGLLQREC
jgi:hypothetical protein